jgi:DNA invertase Pin-like site-specific DNA recombinase
MTAKSAVPKRVVDRLDEAAVRELIEARQAGAKLRELVEQYGISESSVKRMMRQSPGLERESQD